MAIWGKAPLQGYPPSVSVPIWKYGDLELWFNNQSEMRLMAFFFERNLSDDDEFSLPTSAQAFTKVPIPNLTQCREEIACLDLPFTEAKEFGTLAITVPSALLKLRFDEDDFRLWSIFQEREPWFYKWQ